MAIFLSQFFTLRSAKQSRQLYPYPQLGLPLSVEN